MRSIGEFIKTTLLGGLVVLLPVYLAVLLLLKSAQLVLKLLGPVINNLPGDYQAPMAILIVVAVCFLIGLIVRTQLGRAAAGAVERNVLERIPGYTLLRDVSHRLGGLDDASSFAVALVEIEEALTPAFIVEEHADGRYTVFVPSVPTPAAGALYILTPERVHRVDVPFATAIACISRWGSGTSALLAAMREREPAV